MAGGIFISYRRDDSRHAAGRLVDRLAQTFGRDQLFIDVDAIEPGLDFVRVLSDKIDSSDVLLALIGPGWLDATDQSGQRRLDNPSDFVRLEIEAALRRSIRVIPVLLDGANLPNEEHLPAGLKPLVRRQTVRITHERFAADAGGLVRSLAAVITPAPSEPPSARALAGGSLRHRLGAWVYGLLAFPAYFVFVLVLHIWTEKLGVSRTFGRPTIEMSTMVLPALLIAFIGIYLRRSRGRACAPSEVVLYWIGGSLPLAVISGVRPDLFGWGIIGPGNWLLGAAVGLVGLALMMLDLQGLKRVRDAAGQPR